MLTELGAVSGPKGCVVRIQDAIKKPWPEMAEAEA
jgi:large subunit ribosomal protein L3